MAMTSHAAGKALIMIDDYTGPGLQSLGYTREGAETENETFWIDVPGDENGGDQGPPIEIQWLGEIARVRLELTKWDPAVYALVEGDVPAGAPGVPLTILPGTLLFANTKFFRLLINCGAGGTALADQPFEPRNFPCAVPRRPRQLNKGTKYSTAVCEFECYKHPTTGILFNTAIV